MRDLRLKLDDRNFDQLLKLGRGLIPGLAPEWTDHNIHDPGITFLELLAWTADAQIYSLGRDRRDERLAYAALMGLAPGGATPAHGLVWLSTPTTPRIIDTGQPVKALRADAAPFCNAVPTWVSRATLQRLSARFADGRPAWGPQAITGHGPSQRPLGDAPAAGDCLRLEFDKPPLSPSELPESADTDAPPRPLLALGFLIDPVPPLPGAAQPEAPIGKNEYASPPLMEAFLEAPSGLHTRLNIVRDSTAGLSRSGVLHLGLPAQGCEARILVLRLLRAPARSPDLRRVALNVLEVEQVEHVEDWLSFGTGQPDQTYRICEPGTEVPRRLHPDDAPLVVRLREGRDEVSWERRRSLDDCSPTDRCYTFDPGTGHLRFGNGINGAAPPRGAWLRLIYQATRGARGALPAGGEWKVFEARGSNPAPIGGGSDARSLADLRRIARADLRSRRPLVTATDLEAAAMACVDLGVSRARELPETPVGTTAALRHLVVARRRQPARPILETPAWLDALHARLSPHLPLGQHLTLLSPSYVSVSIEAELVADPRRDVDEIREEILLELEQRLALLPATAGDPVWPMGRALSLREIEGWLRKHPAVRRIQGLRLLKVGRPITGGTLPLGPTGLPLFDAGSSRIHFVKSPPSGER